MDDYALEKSLLQDYPRIGARQDISEHCRYCLQHLQKKKERSRVRKAILVTQLVWILLLLVLVPTTTFAAIKISDVLLSKLKNVNLSDEQINQINNHFIDGDFADDDIKYYDSLNVNESGQTYGPELLQPDLISVISEEGYEGYVYKEALLPPEFSSPEEAIEWQERNVGDQVIPVYESDGKTVIGTFIIHKSDTTNTE